MNNREIYVMFDTVSGQFGEPFTMANDAELRRQFEQTVVNSSVPAYVITDTLVFHLGTFVPDRVNPQVVPDAVVPCVLRGGAYNVEKIRGESRNVDAAASELHSDEDC